MATETESKLSSWISSLLPTDESLKTYSTLASLLGATGGALGMFDSTKPPVGYQGGIPTYTPVRRRVANTYDPTRRPGSGGQRYFTDTQFVNPDEAQGALDTAATQAQGLEALNLANPARQTRPITPPVISPTQPTTAGGVGTLPVIPTSESLVGNTVTLAKGGIASVEKGRYLEGKSDGMADAVPAMIENEQPAALSDGEFVIPADVVSHLGNGNSDAGAKVLEDMMGRIREARTGETKQAPEINPKEFLPA